MLALILLALSIHPGVERWEIKTSLVPGVVREGPLFVPLGTLTFLPSPDGVRHNDPRYQHARIPDGIPSVSVKTGNTARAVVTLHEGMFVATEGYLTLAALEGDGDYHLQLGRTPDDATCFIVESPAPSYVKDRTTALWVRRGRAAMGKAVHLPGRAGAAIRYLHPTRVRCEGQLFFDDAHVGDKPRGKKGQKAASLWELHPVVCKPIGGGL